MSVLSAGDQAPDFKFINQDEESVSLGDFPGKYVIMWWYPKASTPGWTKEGLGFRDRIQEFNDKNCQILGVSFDKPGSNKNFKEKNDFPFDLLSDLDKQISISVGVTPSDSGSASRMSVLIGPDGKVIKVYNTVKPAEHPDQVLRDLSNL